jgi:hypothetical protein
MKTPGLFLLVLMFFGRINHAQELYVFSEPASNMPARSVSAKLSAHLVEGDNIYGRFSQRYMPEIMFGFSKNLMVHVSATFADMHTNNFAFESTGLYAKYRFLSFDDIHKHFRMAVFADASYTRAPFHYDEITLMGDKSGVGAGIIATQLWKKFALSATVGHTQVLDESRSNDVIYVPSRNYQSMEYSLSAGYLVLPRQYTDYRQTNLNVYVEMLAQQTLDRPTYFLDMAPAIQLIFNSNAKLNIGYRFQVGGKGTMDRMTNRSWLIAFERTFLNALRKK